MERCKPNTIIAGIDVGKARLDVALYGRGETLAVNNDPAGIASLLDWLKSHGVTRVGLEATGGYERAVREAMGSAGLEVVTHQPLEVRLFARLKRLKAKNDRLDAVLIDPPSFQWTPMLAFRSWRGVSDEREASGLSGDLQTRSG